MQRHSYYDIDKIFLRSLTVQDIAEPLPSFDSNSPAEDVQAAMELDHLEIVGVREGGYVTGYIKSLPSGDGPCGDYAHPIQEDQVLPGIAPLTDLVLALNRTPFLFVNLLGEVGGIVTRADLQDPPVRMWLFGLITLIEMRFLDLIELRFQDEGWQKYLSNQRLEKALALQAERQRRMQNPRLLDCLQFSDKAQHRPQVVHLDVVTDMNPVTPQQITQERRLHSLLLDQIHDWLVQVTRPDAIVARVVKPVVTAQQHRQVGLAHSGHSQQGDAFVLPGAEFVNGELHATDSRFKTASTQFNRNTVLRQKPVASIINVLQQAAACARPGR